MNIDTNEIERVVRRELQGPLGDRETDDDERLLQAVREAATEHDGLGQVTYVDGDAAVVGARLALRLLCRLGRKYVGEARAFPGGCV